jgi:hypothetical protein
MWKGIILMLLSLPPPFASTLLERHFTPRHAPILYQSLRSVSFSAYRTHTRAHILFRSLVLWSDAHLKLSSLA